MCRRMRDHDDRRSFGVELLKHTHHLLAVIGIGDERVYRNSTVHRSFQRALDFHMVEPEDGDLDGFLSAVDLFNERRHSAFRLDQEFHLAARSPP